MATQFVILASGLNGDPMDVEATKLLSKYRQVDEILPPSTLRGIDGIANVTGFFFSDHDGGNGGGGGDSGGALRKVVIGKTKRTFWRFPSIPSPAGIDRESKFPPVIRWELCILVESYDHLVKFFDSDDGVILQARFNWVQYVALSTAAPLSTAAAI